jgi:hypothetical protein
VNVGGDHSRLESLKQTGDEIEVCLVDASRIDLKRVGAVRDAVEDDTRPHVVEQGVEIRIDEEIERSDVLRIESLESPGGASTRRADRVRPDSKNAPKEIRPDEPTCSKDQNRTLELRNLRVQIEYP